MFTTANVVIAWVSLISSDSVLAQAPETAHSSTANSGSPDLENSSALGDIVVTAQKRAERLQNVPVAVTAVSGQGLVAANITETKALSSVVPSLNFTTSAAFAQPFIRGVGSRGNTAFDEQIVPMYVDGVYQIGMTAGLFKLNSIERIEVLRGPQGTLFGRNAVGGAINVVTRDPSRDASGEVMLGYGRFNEMRGELYATGPLSDTLSANISLMRHRDDGYARDVFRGTKEQYSSTTSFRSKLLWQPNDSFQAKLTAFYLSSQDNSGVTSFPLDGNAAAPRVDPTVFLGSGYKIANSFSPYAKSKSYGGSIDVEYEIDGVTFTSLSSYYRFRSEFNLDTDATASTVPGFLTNTSFTGRDVHDVYTQELRAASNGDGPLQWLIGGFLFRDKLKNPHPFYRSFGPTGPSVDVEGDALARSFALFGEAKYNFTPEFSVKVGVRYSKDIRSASTFDFLANAGLASGKHSWHDISPRVTLDYEIAPRQKVYFTYSEAYKSGTILQPTFTVSTGFYNIVDPEKLRSFEIGYKGDITNNFRANVAAYYYDYKDVQVVGQGLLPSGSIFSFLQNAAKEEIYGVDADLTYAPAVDWTVGLAAAWVHARYASFPNATINVRRDDGLGNRSVTRDVSGNRIQRTPDFTISANSGYTLPYDVFGGRLRLSGNVFYSTGWYFDLIETIGTGDYVDVNARASWTSANDRYTIALWGSNLTNSNRLLAVSQSGPGDRAGLVRPISYGAEIRYRF
jgi:Outer membrane receptor proteins, mostly Fe transport